MRVIAQDPWNWTLLEDADGHYFSVLCGGVAMFAIEFKLTAEESDEFSRDLQGAATILSQRVRADQDEFGQRHLVDFSTRTDVRQAGLRWRKERRAEA
jgi:hypothetical protein